MVPTEEGGTAVGVPWAEGAGEGRGLARPPPGSPFLEDGPAGSGCSRKEAQPPGRSHPLPGRRALCSSQR